MTQDMRELIEKFQRQRPSSQSTPRLSSPTPSEPLQSLPNCRNPSMPPCGKNQVQGQAALSNISERPSRGSSPPHQTRSFVPQVSFVSQVARSPSEPNLFSSTSTPAGSTRTEFNGSSAARSPRQSWRLCSSGPLSLRSPRPRHSWRSLSPSRHSLPVNRPLQK